jgi:ubiquinone/menaquinone biosynthesis C-methylase UbiE
MKKEDSFSGSRMAHLLFKVMAPVMESPLRYRFFNPVKSLKLSGIQIGQTVLEVGCGTGFFTIPAARLIRDEGRIYAVDPHPLAIKQVKKKVRDAGLTNVRLIRADATRCGLARGMINLVVLYGVIPSPTLPMDRLLEEMYRLLKPNGKITVWTAFPCWSAESLTKSGLFAYIGKEKGVYNFRRIDGN